MDLCSLLNFWKSCVHIYFWLVLGKKYHRVFIKQRRLTFDNVTDQLVEKRLFTRTSQSHLGKDGKEGEKQNAEGLSQLRLAAFPSLLQREGPPSNK